MGNSLRERQGRFVVGADWTMPDLTGIAPGDARVSTATAQVSSTYFDTADHALLDHGIILRRRSGRWQLQLPAGSPRIEINVDGGRSARTVPAQVRALLIGVRAGAALEPIAKVDTARQLAHIVDAQGTVLAEVADDNIHAIQLGTTAVVTTWREIDVHVVNGDKGLVRRIGKALRSAGARAQSSEPAELARTLGKLGEDASILAPARTVGETAHAYLDAQYRAVVTADLALREGGEPIHATRVAIRRYRSVLRVLADVFDTDRAAKLDADLAWYARLLGAVRDRQVLRAHLERAVEALPAELIHGPVAARIEGQLLGDELRAKDQLVKAMRSKRYAGLMADLRHWQLEPPFTAAADRPSADVKTYLRKARRQLDRRLAAARANGTDNEQVHRARKAGKRARYVAELAEPVLGKSVRRYATRASAMQDALGAHQDSVVAREVLWRLAAATADAPAENGFTYGLLYAQEMTRGAESRRHAAVQIKRL